MSEEFSSLKTLILTQHFSAHKLMISQFLGSMGVSGEGVIVA
jgi:hypothetical protein